jgi:hypothetical protein
MKSKSNVGSVVEGKLMNTVGAKGVPTGFTAPKIELTSFVPSSPTNDPVPRLSVNSSDMNGDIDDENETELEVIPKFPDMLKVPDNAVAWTVPPQNRAKLQTMSKILYRNGSSPKTAGHEV